jgi:predicted Zn-dependent protease
MKHTMIVMALLAASAPAYAQLGGIGGSIRKAQEAKSAVDELTITDEEERKIGEEVSLHLRQRFGVVQDPAIHKYVSLLGTTLAKESDRPNLNWTFVVLDTDGVNAFASPGGLVHITRGALALAKNEAEVAGVIGHEIGHVVKKHTVNAIRKGKMVQMGTSAASRNSALQQLANRSYEMILENNFDRADEMDADSVGVALTKKAGYSASQLSEFLARLDERNKNATERNGLFADHPQTKARIDKIKQLAGSANGAVLVEPRYKTNMKYELKPITALASGEGDKSKGLSGSAPESNQSARQNTQVQASGGARGIGADRAAKGGDNPAIIKATVSAVEVATFKTGIV